MRKNDEAKWRKVIDEVRDISSPSSPQLIRPTKLNDSSSKTPKNTSFWISAPGILITDENLIRLVLQLYLTKSTGLLDASAVGDGLEVVAGQIFNCLLKCIQMAIEFELREDQSFVIMMTMMTRVVNTVAELIKEKALEVAKQFISKPNPKVSSSGYITYCLTPREACFLETICVLVQIFRIHALLKDSLVLKLVLAWSLKCSHNDYMQTLVKAYI